MSNVTVSVYDGPILVAEKQRPVRRLPDGRFGVLFRGLVYPIGRAQQIQLRGGSHEKEECIVLDSVPEELQTSDANDPIIHLDASGKYKYLMVMGDEVALHFVLAVEAPPSS